MKNPVLSVSVFDSYKFVVLECKTFPEYSTALPLSNYVYNVQRDLIWKGDARHVISMFDNRFCILKCRAAMTSRGLDNTNTDELQLILDKLAGYQIFTTFRTMNKSGTPDTNDLQTYIQMVCSTPGKLSPHLVPENCTKEHLYMIGALV